MKERTTNLQLSSILFLGIFASTIGISPYTSIKIASLDSYISVIIGFIIGMIPFFIFLYIFNYKKTLDINTKNRLILGKLGIIFSILLTTLYFIVGMTTVFNISNFIISQYLTDTPLILIIIVIVFTSGYIASKGIKTISKTSFIYFILVIMLFIICILGILPEIKLDNLKPFLEYGLKKPFIAGIMNALFYTTPIYPLLIIPKDDIKDNEKTSKILLLFYFILMVITFSIAIVSSAVLGKYLLNFFQYPGYITLKRISLFKFIDRIENFLSLQWIIANFTYISLIIFYINNTIFKKNKKIFITVISILLIIGTYLIFENNTIFNNYLTNIYPYILLAIFILYIIIFIGAFIRKKFNK